jgi:hypothetical protein
MLCNSLVVVGAVTPHNEQQLLRRGRAAPTGYEKPQSGLCPFVRFFSATFFVRWNCYAIPSSRTKNVSCFTVKRHYFSPQVSRRTAASWRGEFVGFYIMWATMKEVYYYL